MTQILKAKPVLKKIYGDLKDCLDGFDKEVVLRIIMAGEDAAAEWYVSNLQKKGSRYGIKVKLDKLSAGISNEELAGLIRFYNEDEATDGIMLQKPLPGHINENMINSLIDPQKDVDGFHPVNLGKLVLDQPALLPCTPQAVLEILKYYQIATAGKKVVVLGRSNIVGKPLGLLLLRKDITGNATVTVCHSRTKDLTAITSEADILIAAIGRARFVKADMIKQGAVVIDVGTNKIDDPEQGEIYAGDVDYAGVSPRASAITPVPGGVGSVTTGMLLTNLLKAAKLKMRK